MGIIGGTDGPTAVFVSGSMEGVIMAICIITAVGVTVYFLRKRKGKR